MSLQYEGQYPNSDASILPKAWADDENDSVLVDAAYVNAQIADAITANALQTQTYVNSQDALRAHKTDVTAADALYVPTSALGAANGVASLSSGNLPTGQVPTGVVTDRVTKAYDAATNGNVFLTSGNTHQVTTQSLREYQLASLPIPDPGWPWRAIPFAIVGGYSNGGTPPGDRTLGSGNLGLLTVMPPSGVGNTVYATAVCTGAYQKLAFYPVLPYGASGNTPTSVPPINGALELDLWGCNYATSGYVFSGTGLVFSVLVMPAI